MHVKLSATPRDKRLLPFNVSPDQEVRIKIQLNKFFIYFNENVYYSKSCAYNSFVIGYLTLWLLVLKNIKNCEGKIIKNKLRYAKSNRPSIF